MMRPQGVAIPRPVPIHASNAQNMLDPTSNPQSGHVLSPISPFSFPTPVEFLSPLTYMQNNFPY